MKTYEFALYFKLPTPDADGADYVEALYGSGCNDASIGHGRKGYIVASFDRESRSLEDAIFTAIRDVREAILGSELIGINADKNMELEFVSRLADEAERNFDKMIPVTKERIDRAWALLEEIDM